VRREDAIERLISVELQKLADDEREEQLFVMTREDWSECPGWNTLDSSVRSEFEDGELRSPYSSHKYDAVLLLWLRSRYAGATSEYIKDRLREIGVDATEVAGEPMSLVACPCCGFASLGGRGDYEICDVCWWEDDGQDNEDADVVMGGPNYHLSLTQARANFLVHGISDPSRDDLRKLQAPVAKYARSRAFELAEDGKKVSEKGSTWESRAFSL
jgi:hypothetical protein